MGLRKRSGSVPTTLPKTTFSSRSMCVYWLYLSCLLSLMYIPARFSSQFGQVRPSCKVWLIFATKSKNRPFNYIKTLHSFNDPPLVLVMQARPLRGHLKEIWGALDSGYYPPLQTLAPLSNGLYENSDLATRQCWGLFVHRYKCYQRFYQSQNKGCWKLPPPWIGFGLLLTA